MKVRWHPDAKADLSDIISYIGGDNLTAAFKQADRIQAAAASLARFPRMGREGRKPGTRELTVPQTPYLIVYHVLDDHLEVLMVVHGARAWPPHRLS
ncbi:type II toxin-antitoxin system RelE/ParE family toxin [Phenylobacterium sp.]|uniref:type II toxin-antitoxin system RelE/ParE family toxin n=1 Tax=Phenylobacterium sp. TaxID=1871053 RepID=UPI0025E13BC5|nr:type II toxin-antitoxin system RelE/ParE family toxin [Phenylobacterium sp.]MBX3483220.1 type II toxin-antitoxin system RelE/ParE family toxin [Phenylobacterium sp.]MCW5760135.1 type II toxin-antitoxin system RelE/ParE family toxin [Phenylobacterium sp.]